MAKGCEGCKHRQKIDGNGASICNYFEDAGMLRGCLPGHGCLRYEKGTRKRNPHSENGGAVAQKKAARLLEQQERQ